jgi:hypothetical protein
VIHQRTPHLTAVEAAGSESQRPQGIGQFGLPKQPQTRLYLGSRIPCRLSHWLQDDSSFRALGPDQAPPAGYDITGCGQMPWVTNQAHVIEYRAESSHLARQTRQAVAAALDLKACKQPVHFDDVCALMGNRDPELLDQSPRVLFWP